MRPRKIILFVDTDEVRVSLRRLQLETRGEYRVVAAHDAGTALGMFAHNVDLVLGFAGSDRASGPRLDWAHLARLMKAINGSTPILLVGDRLNPDELSAVDRVLAGARLSTAELIETVRVAIARKRGPAKINPAMAIAAAMAAGD